MPTASPPSSRSTGTATPRSQTDEQGEQAASNLISQRAYARHKGWQPSYVNKLVKLGIIPLREKRIDPIEADAAIAKHRDPARRSRQVKTATTAQVESNGSADPAPTEPGVTEFDSTVSYASARAMREAYRARREKLLFEQLQGRLIDVGDVKVAAFNKARIVRDALLNIPDRISAVLTAEGDQEKVHALLSAEIRQALEDLTIDTSPSDTEEGSPDDADAPPPTA